MASASTDSLLDALRQYRLLEAAQLEEAKLLAARFPDPKALARELLQRGWLTAYQANQLFQGRGHELLLGGYVLLERLGEGGMGQVFKARSWKLGRVVALKLIRKEHLDNPDAIRRFEREVRSAAALSHPNIVHALDADQVGGIHLLVMEYVEGTDLARLVKQTGPLPVPQACEYIRQAALGLQHACERGLVHRDIKPANLLLTADGRTVKVLDLGLARLTQAAAADDRSGTMTQEGAIMGTPDFIAPEQARHAHTVDSRADLYSLGCTLYYLLAGRVPFSGSSLTEKLLQHQLDEPQPVEALRPEVLPGVAAVVRKLMAKKPADRYQTPAAAAAALAPVCSSGSAPTDGEDRTVAAGSLAVALAAPSGDPRASPFASLRTETAAPMASPLLRQRQARDRRLLLAAASGAAVLIGLAVLLFALFRDPGRKKAPGQEADHPVVDITPPRKTPPHVDDAWHKQVAGLPAHKQVEAVAARLKERNPGFDGKVPLNKVEAGVVTEIGFSAANVTDLSPVRALVELKVLVCFGGKTLSDLSPLKDMKLTSLNCTGTKVTDLSPLKDLKLTYLYCGDTKVIDLSPLKDMKLTHLHCGSTNVADLSPLKDMKLNYLTCNNTLVADLSPLKGMPLKELRCDFKPERDAEMLRALKTLERINDKPAQEVLGALDDKKP